MRFGRLIRTGLLVNGHDLAIVRAILLVAKSMRLRVVAEGVETPEQFQCLQREGCHGIQGYLFSKAVPPEGLTEFLKPDSKRLSPSLRV